MPAIFRKGSVIFLQGCVEDVSPVATPILQEAEKGEAEIKLRERKTRKMKLAVDHVDIIGEEFWILNDLGVLP